MLNNTIKRTTISLPKDLLFEIKKKALLESKTLTSLISEGLRIYLGLNSSSSMSQLPRIHRLFGSWGKGEKGASFVRKMRKQDNKRNNYINSLWKKS